MRPLTQCLPILLGLALAPVTTSTSTTTTPPFPIGTPTPALPASALPSAFLPSLDPPALSTLTIAHTIRQTLALYALIIDGKQFGLLHHVFHENVWANYSALIGVFHPLGVLQEGLETALRAVTSQHVIAEVGVVVEDKGDGEDGDGDGDGNANAKRNGWARSATYFTASHFGTGEFYGEALWGWGTYQDNWTRDSEGRWKIVERTIIYPGPLFGNVSIFGDITGGKKGEGAREDGSKAESAEFAESLRGFVPEWLKGTGKGEL